MFDPRLMWRARLPPVQDYVTKRYISRVKTAASPRMTSRPLIDSMTDLDDCLLMHLMSVLVIPPQPGLRGETLVTMMLILQYQAHLTHQ